MKIKQTKYLRNKEIVLRKEFFGGIAFNKKRAITLELDKEGFYLLLILNQPFTLIKLKQQLSKKFSRVFSDSEIKLILNQYYKEGFLDKSLKSKHTPKHILTFQEDLDLFSNTLSAPETVHLSITGKCNLNCPFCYERSDAQDLSTKQIFDLIDKLALMKIFQLAIGGGEPFLRKDIFKIIDYCQKRDLVVNLTTNGILITEEIAEKIRNKVGQINVSYNELVNKDAKKLKKILNILFKNNIKVGINLLITKEILFSLTKTIKELLNYRISKIIILRPKPCDNKKWYEENKLRKKDLLKLKKILDKFNGKINVDCSLTCLMHNIPKQELKEKAVYGCVAGERFCTIKNNGDVYPCSFFNTNEFLAGNILKSDFKTIWQKTEMFKKFRMNNKIKGKCGSCEIKDYCKGCRRIVLESEQDFYSEEKECPKKEI